MSENDKIKFSGPHGESQVRGVGVLGVFVVFIPLVCLPGKGDVGVTLKLYSSLMNRQSSCHPFKKNHLAKL